MGYKIALSEIENIISQTYFANKGDRYERTYWPLIKERFPNCETFWRYFVVPCTKRIELEGSELDKTIRHREGIHEDIEDITSFHYSMFVNLIYSYDHLQKFGLSSFEDFYVHLVSACDLAEEFLIKTHLLILECRGQKTEILQRRKSISNILEEYFQKSVGWEEYKSHTRKVRQYRNIIVHDVQIGKIAAIDVGIVLVPKKEKIQNYKKWTYVFRAQNDIQRIKKDFINMKEQMILDIGRLEIILNKLWVKPINDLKKLFFHEKNQTLLSRYNIDLT